MLSSNFPSGRPLPSDRYSVRCRASPGSGFSHPTSCVRWCFPVLFLLIGTAACPAQKQLFAALNNSKGYVVGATLQESGIFRYDGDTTWSHIGWNHPFIGGIAFADGADGTIHVAAGNGEMRSMDGGDTWKITTGWQVTEAQDIALDYRDRERIYLATAYGIWISRNDGESWRQVTDDYTQAVVADIFGERRAIAAAERGLMLTEDGGDSWRHVGPETAMVDVAQSVYHPPEWIAASRSKGVFRSHDDGETWTIALQFDSGATAVAIDPDQTRHQSAATWGQGLFVSEDGGVTWTNRTRGLPTPYLVETIFDANRGDGLWVATREEGIYYSEDLGRTWTYAGLTGTMVFDMVYPE